MSIVLDKRTIIHRAIDMPEGSGKLIILERQHRLERAHPPPHR
jgi:hypothetical protein